MGIVKLVIVIFKIVAHAVKTMVLSIVSAVFRNLGYQSVPSADLKKCISCKEIEGNQKESNCIQCSLRTQNGVIINYISHSQIIYNQSTKSSEIENQIEQYQFYCDQCAKKYFLTSDYHCSVCIDNCEICYQGDLTESIENQQGYFTLLYKYIRTIPTDFIKKCLKCEQGYFLQKNISSLADEQCLPVSQLTENQRINNCLTIVISGNTSTCRFCNNSGQQLGTNVCNIPLQQYKKDSKCTSFYKTDNSESYFCDLCLQDYVPSPLGCIPCRSSVISCSLVSMKSRKENLFSVLHLQLFKQSFTQYEEQNYFSIYQMKEDPIDILCQNLINPVQGRCIISECSQSSCFSCKATQFGQEYCDYCRSSDPNKNEYYDQIFKPSMISRRRVQILNSFECISCDRYCDACTERTDEEITKLNPYFVYQFMHSKQLTEYYTSFTSKCIQSRSISEQCLKQNIQNQDQVTQSIKCDQDINKLGVYYHSLFNRFTICEQGQSSCKKSIRFAKIIDCSVNSKYTKLSDIYKDEQFMVDPFIYKIQNSSMTDSTIKVVLDFLEYENILYANNVLNEELITDYEYLLFIIPDENNSCSIQNHFTIKSTIASKVFAVETISLQLIPLLHGKISQDTIITLNMSSNVNIEGFNTVKLNNLQISNLQASEYNENTTIGIDLSKNLFAVEIFLTNITFLKNTLITSSPERPSLTIKNIFSKLKKIIMKNVIFKNWDFNNGIGPFDFPRSSNLDKQEIEFIAEIEQIKFITVFFKNTIIFPIFNPQSTISIKELTFEDVKFINSTISNDNMIPLFNLNARMYFNVHDLKITQCLFDASSLLSYSNNNSYLNLENVQIDETNKFRNGNEIDLVLARKLTVKQFNIGCKECETDNYLDLNQYRVFTVPELSEVQKAGNNTFSIFSIEDFAISNSIFRQKGFAINSVFVPQKVSHLVHSIILQTIKLTNIQCRGTACIDGLTAINISGVNDAKINDIQILNSNGFQLLKVASSKAIQIVGVRCSNEDLERTDSSSCLILSNYFLYAYIAQVTIYHLQSQGQQDSLMIPTSAQELQDFLKSSQPLGEIITQCFEGQLETSPIIIMESISLEEVSLYPKKEGQNIGAIMIQNNLMNRSFIQTLSITNSYVVKEEGDMQELIAGLYYTSTNDFLVLESFQISGIDTEYSKMINYIDSNKIRILNGTFKDSNSLKYESIVQGGFFNIVTQDLLVVSSMFFASKSNYGGALYITNFQSAVVKIIGPKTIFYSNIADQQGGGIYINSNNNIDILVSDVTIQSLIALNSGGFFFIKSEKVTNLVIQKSHFKDCFCEQGSIMNFDSNSIHSDLTIKFDSNSYTSPRKYDHFSVFDNDIKQGAMFYVLKANVLLQNNTFWSIYINSPLVYHFSGSYVEYNNTYKDIELDNPPFIFLQKTSVKINEFGDSTKKNTYEDIRMLCLSQNKCTVVDINKIQYLYSIDNPTSPPQMHNMIFKSIKCNQCGLIYNAITSNESKMIITNSSFIQNSLFLSPIVVVSFQAKSRRLILDQTEQRKLQKDGHPIKYPDEELNIYDLKIVNCKFIKNIVINNGGALLLKEVNSKLEDVFCQLNQSKKEGGCLYYFSEKKTSKMILLLLRSKIIENEAKIGGGVRVIGTEAIKQNSEIVNNKIALYGQDYLSYPMGISLSLFKDGQLTHLGVTYGKDTITVYNWVTGETDNKNGFFIIEFLDINQVKMTVPDASVEIQLHEDELNNHASKIDGIKKFQFNSNKNSVQLQDVVYKKQPLDSLKVKVTSSSIKYPIFDLKTGLLTDYGTNFFFVLKIEMRECLVGEAFFDISGECRMCDKDYYSLHKSSTQCLECPSRGIESCDGGNRLKLASGWWRPDLFSDTITECRDFKSGCLGGYESGDQSCKLGYIGALCQSCDIYGKVWGERYSKSSLYTCKNCKEYTDNVNRLIALGMFVSISLFLSIRSQIKSITLFKHKYYLIRMGFLKPGKSILQENQVTIVIKILTTYLQIIGHLSRFEMRLPSGLDELTSIIGNPIRQVSHSLDCQIVEASGQVPIVYARVISKLAQPILLLLISIAIYSIFSVMTRNMLKKTALYTITFYTIIYMQPSIVQELISSMACSEVSGIYYITSDFNYQCYNDIYYSWTLTLILPAYIFWCFILPLFLFLKLKVNQHLLATPKFKEKFGFLYNEYRQKVYFWELLKTTIKILIVGVVEFYSSNIHIKGILIIVICFIYAILLKRLKPYQDINMNQLDKLAINTCLVSIILVVFYYKNPFTYFQYITLILLIVANAIFIAKVFINLLREYTLKFSARIDQYRQKLHKYFPRISNFLKINSVTLARKQYLWQVLRNQVDRFVKELKNSQQLLNENGNQQINCKKLKSFESHNIIEYTPSTTLQSFLSIKINLILFFFYRNRLKSFKSKTTLDMKTSSKTNVFKVQENKMKRGLYDKENEFLHTSSQDIPNENINVQDTKSNRELMKFNQFQNSQKIDVYSFSPKMSTRQNFDFPINIDEEKNSQK